MSPPPEFTIRLRAQTDQDDPEGIRRLRAALKRLGRAYGLRCVGISPAIDPPVSDPQAPAAPVPPGAPAPAPPAPIAAAGRPCRSGPPVPVGFPAAGEKSEGGA